MEKIYNVIARFEIEDFSDNLHGYVRMQS